MEKRLEVRRAGHRALGITFLLLIAGLLAATGVMQGAPLWSNGAVNQNTVGATDGGSPGPFTIFDNFTVGQYGWLITGFDYSDFFVGTSYQQVTSTQWSIWSGDPLHGGTLVVSGNAAIMGANLTPNCSINGGITNACLVQLTVSNLSIKLNAGTYWLGTSTVSTGSAPYRALATGNGLPGYEQSNGTTSGVVGSQWIQGSLNATYSNQDTAFDINGTQLPEPGTLSLMGLAIAGFCLLRRRRSA